MEILEDEIKQRLVNWGAAFVHYIDISHLFHTQNKNLPNAVLLGVTLKTEYLREVMNAPGYVQTIIKNNTIEDDEFHLTEMKAGELADRIAEYIVSKGYQAYSQSDNNLIANNGYDAQNRTTLLPHKTIAVTGGIGWIGKNNLLITNDYGCALCLGSVLTDAPLSTLNPQIYPNKCGNCKTCFSFCEENALKGQTWYKGITREEIIDVNKCSTCMECLVHCGYTQKYMKSPSIKNVG